MAYSLYGASRRPSFRRLPRFKCSFDSRRMIEAAVKAIGASMPRPASGMPLGGAQYFYLLAYLPDLFLLFIKASIASLNTSSAMIIKIKARFTISGRPRPGLPVYERRRNHDELAICRIKENRQLCSHYQKSLLRYHRASLSRRIRTRLAKAACCRPIRAGHITNNAHGAMAAQNNDFFAARGARRFAHAAE